MKLTLEDLKLILSGGVDSRVKDTNLQIASTHSQYKLVAVFCIYCSKQHGWVSQESSKYISVNNIICVCDTCHAGLGSLPLDKVPDEVIQDIKK